jgi:CheY-like chemotaxis protein
MNGFEVCRKIRQEYLRTTLPIIMVSAKADVEQVVEGLEAGTGAGGTVRARAWVLTVWVLLARAWVVTLSARCWR